MRMAASVSSLVFLLSTLGPALSPMICCSSEPFYNGRWLHYIQASLVTASGAHIYKLSRRKNINIYREYYVNYVNSGDIYNIKVPFLQFWCLS